MLIIDLIVRILFPIDAYNCQDMNSKSLSVHR